MLRRKLAGRLLHQQDLTIDTRVHGVPPSGLAIIDAAERATYVQLHRCALRQS
jgi:hypothetical protein